MIKLFETYEEYSKIENSVSVFFYKLRIFLLSVLLKDNHKVEIVKYNNTQKHEIIINVGNDTLFELIIDFKDSGDVNLEFGYSWLDFEKTYSPLEKYLFYKFLPYFPDATEGDDVFSQIKDFDLEEVMKINFSKKEFEKFKDAERFGL